jgi:hypothetical protein
MPEKMPTQPKPRPRHPDLLISLGCVIAVSTVTPAALAADNPGAHEHGHARLQMAVDDSRIDLMLNSPAHNLAGFEHEAHSDAQKKQLADINRWLETTPLINTVAADCRVTAATVELDGGEESRGEDNHHEHGHDDHHEEATHREYEVTQQLECDRIEADQEFTSALMEKFEGMEELTVEWISPSGQGSARLTSSNQAFAFDN